jgi:hypothetical protein
LRKLASATHHNGKTGMVVVFDNKRDRWGVRLADSGEVIAVKEANLVVFPERLNAFRSAARSQPETDVETVESDGENFEKRADDRLKRRAYAAVVAEFYKVPREQREALTAEQLRQRVAARYAEMREQGLLQEVEEGTAWSVYDTDEAPVPVLDVELDASCSASLHKLSLGLPGQALGIESGIQLDSESPRPGPLDASSTRGQVPCS